MFCERCGKEVPSDAAACPHCAAPIEKPQEIKSYLAQSIVVTILCCTILGIPAIFYAAQVSSRMAENDIEGAEGLRESESMVHRLLGPGSPPSSLGLHFFLLFRSMTENNGKRRCAPPFFRILAVGAALFGGMLFLYFHDPEQTPVFPDCPWRLAPGMPCPWYGSGRAMYAALHGDLHRAFRLNVLMFPALTLAALLIWKPSLAAMRGLARIVLIVVVGFWILRNIPVRPFSLLAPHAETRLELDETTQADAARPSERER